MSTPTQKTTVIPSIFYSKLLWQTALVLFLCVLAIELIALYPLTHYDEKQTLLFFEQLGGSGFSIVHNPLFDVILLLLIFALLISLIVTLILYQIVLKPIQSSVNALLKRISTSQKIIKAHDSVLELRVEEQTKELSQIVNYDPLTQLPNYNLLQEILNQYLEQAKSDKKNVALLILSLNDFHEINNAYGSDTSTAFIKFIARELTNNVPIGTCVARIRGSQFAIARGELTSTHQVANLAQWIIDLFSSPITINEHRLLTSVNLGIALYPIDAISSENLISSANIALNRANNTNLNSYQFYKSNMNQIIEERHKMMVELHYALERNELIVYYQPQVDLNTRKIIGVEALLRWTHPEKGLIPPGFFISLTEESGLIIPITAWVLKMACEQVLAWQALGLPLLTVAVNLSGKQFKQKNIVEMINRTLLETKLPPNQLEVEITESVIVDNLEEAISIMKALQGLGVSISIDDFGTGYSSLSYLTQFPIQKLKIDQSFIRGIGQPGEESPLLEIILLLAKKLNLTVIAEGVENETQAQYLKEKGCDACQGYLYGKPMPAEEIVALFR